MTQRKSKKDRSKKKHVAKAPQRLTLLTGLLNNMGAKPMPSVPQPQLSDQQRLQAAAASPMYQKVAEERQQHMRAAIAKNKRMPLLILLGLIATGLAGTGAAIYHYTPWFK